MRSWRGCKLGELGIVLTGKTPSSKNPKDWGFEMPFVTPSDYKNYGKFALSSERNLSKNGISRLQNKVLPENSIMVTCIGSDMGKVAMNKIPVITNQQINSIITDSNIVDSDFLYYRLVSLYETLRIYGSDGTAVPIVNKTDFENLETELPPLEEQKAIAEVLSSLDDKIDLLHRQNQTLESLAGTLFRQWFIEEAKEEWDDISLVKCCRKITKGTTPTTLKKQFVGSGINFIKVNCIDEKGNFLKDKFDFIDDETNELLNRSKLEKGDILYSIAGTIGRLAMVNDEILPANVNQALAILRVDKSVINPYFVKYCLLDKDITFELHSKIVHAVQPNLSLSEISNTLIPYPPKEILDNFSNQIEPIEEKINQNKEQIQTLENLRDTLLPKLLSGEGRVGI
jgi:type I restriction enzyme S subunit